VEFDAEQTRRPHTLPLNPPEHARDKLAGPTTRIEHEVTGTRPSSGEQLPDHAIHDVLRRGNESFHRTGAKRRQYGLKVVPRMGVLFGEGTMGEDAPK